MATGFSTTTQFDPWAIPTEPVKRYSVEEYHHLIEIGVLTDDAPYELIEGWLVRKMPKGRLHEYALARLNKAITKALCEAWECRVQSPVTLSDGEPEPDILIVRGPESRYLARIPNAQDAALVIEVSDTTLTRDRGVKLRSYARASIPEYWIVNIEERQVEVYTRPSPDGSYAPPRIYSAGDSVALVLEGQTVVEIAVSSLLEPIGT